MIPYTGVSDEQIYEFHGPFASQASLSAAFFENFKREAVRLVVEEKYTFAAAAQAVGVSPKLRCDLKRGGHKKRDRPRSFNDPIAGLVILTSLRVTRYVFCE